jgi:hypothetical protein
MFPIESWYGSYNITHCHVHCSCEHVYYAHRQKQKQKQKYTLLIMLRDFARLGNSGAGGTSYFAWIVVKVLEQQIHQRDERTSPNVRQAARARARTSNSTPPT